MTEIIPVTLPKWGLEMSEGTISAWHLSEGDAAEPGAELVDIETDKIVNAVELDRAGTLRRIVVPAGETVPVGTLIAVLAPADTPEEAIDRFVADFEPVDASFDLEEEATAPKPDAPDAAAPPDAAAQATPLARRTAAQMGVDLGTVPGTGRKGKVVQQDVTRAAPRDPESLRGENAAVFASPVARKFADEVGLPLAGLSGTGRKGRVSLADARSAAEAAGLWHPPAAAPGRAGPVAPAGPAQPGPLQPFTGMRKSIATSLVRSKQTVPHFYTTIEVEIDALLALRKQMNDAAEDGAPKISVNDVLLRAAGLALAAHPDVNVHVSDDGITPFDKADIAMAVAVEGGLVAPVVRDAAGRGLRAIAAETADLSARARARTLQAEELAGGTFTLSNLGMFGVRTFDAIITPPQAAVLAVGGPRRDPREAADGGVRFATVLSATLSADHRAVDGALAAQFLATLRGMLESPARLLS